MSENSVSLIKKFVSIPSTPDNSRALEKIMALALSQLKGYTVEHFERKGVKSVLIYHGAKRPKRFKILLNGHLDIIPGKVNQYMPHIKGNRLYGAGAMDMKANVVCLIEIFKEVAKKVEYPLGLQLVTDEEVGGFNGTKYQVEKGVRADFVIASEPTNFDIVHKAKGVLWVNVSARGKTAHGAYPWRGENAILKMHEFLNTLQKRYQNLLQEKWVTTVNVARIETSNTAFNKIPDDCTLSLDIRSVPEESESVVKEIKKLLPKGFGLEIIAKEPALNTSLSNEHIKLLGSVGAKVLKKKIVVRGAQGSSDARHFLDVGCPGIEFGPVGGGIGSDNEWVDIPSLEKFSKILKNFLLELNKS